MYNSERRLLLCKHGCPFGVCKQFDHRKDALLCICQDRLRGWAWAWMGMGMGMGMGTQTGGRSHGASSSSSSGFLSFLLPFLLANWARPGYPPLTWRARGGLTGIGKAWHGKAWHGMAWHMAVVACLSLCKKLPQTPPSVMIAWGFAHYINQP
ncbi:hypothetical protein F4780DRAFT_677947 [Xylariomycetidae sp. FL0641]|nr:hypothetical protein F4780DRAFT_677947 [Xylariomycetidae sp. FL0641]